MLHSSSTTKKSTSKKSKSNCKLFLRRCLAFPHYLQNLCRLVSGRNGVVDPARRTTAATQGRKQECHYSTVLRSGILIDVQDFVHYCCIALNVNFPTTFVLLMERADIEPGDEVSTSTVYPLHAAVLEAVGEEVSRTSFELAGSAQPSRPQRLGGFLDGYDCTLVASRNRAVKASRTRTSNRLTTSICARPSRLHNARHLCRVDRGQAAGRTACT